MTKITLVDNRERITVKVKGYVPSHGGSLITSNESTPKIKKPRSDGTRAKD